MAAASPSLFRGLLSRYDMLIRSFPIRTKMITAFGISVVGDVISQYVVAKRSYNDNIRALTVVKSGGSADADNKFIFKVDIARTLRYSTVNSLFGGSAHL